MKYNRNDIEILGYLEGRGGIMFVEYRIKSTGNIKILSLRNFKERYGE